MTKDRFHGVSDVNFISKDIFFYPFHAKLYSSRITTVGSSCGSKSVISTDKAILYFAIMCAAITISIIFVIAFHLVKNAIPTHLITHRSCWI